MVKSKKKENIVEAIIKTWIAIFGVPRVILSDNGGEFNNELLREGCEKFNITMKSTTAEAPWSNGIVEQHNTVLRTMINKPLELMDPQTKNDSDKTQDIRMSYVGN